MEHRIIKILEEKSFEQKITLNSKIEDLNIDSLSYVEVIVMIEKEFNIEFELEMLDKNYVKSVNDIVLKVKEKLYESK